MSDDSEDSFTEAAALEDFVVLFLCFPRFLPFWLLLRQHFFSHRLCGSKCALCPFVRVL